MVCQTTVKMWQSLPQTRARLQKVPVVEKTSGKGEEELLQRFSRSWPAIDETFLMVDLVLKPWGALAVSHVTLLSPACRGCSRGGGWTQGLGCCPGAVLTGALLRASPVLWQRLCSNLGAGGEIFIARAGLGCRWPR